MSLRQISRAITVGWVLCSAVFGLDPYMLPYRDSLVFMVHGINSDRYTWFASDKLGKPDLDNGTPNLWLHYLNKELKIGDKSLFSYSFSKSSGDNIRDMMELGGVGYKSEGGNPGAENNSKTLKVNDQDITGKTGITLDTTRTWLEQAVAEYRNGLQKDTDINVDPITKRPIWENANDIPDALLPSKLVMLTTVLAGVDVNRYTGGRWWI